MLRSPGALLRAWRLRQGWTQAELAQILSVSSAAISSWETGARRIPLDCAEKIDELYDAGGCLVDLVSCIETPRIVERGRGARLPVPRRYWPRVFGQDSGPVWIWIRSDRGRGVGGYVLSTSGGLRFDRPEEGGCAACDGLFVILPFWEHTWPLQVLLDQPGWVDFGRGLPPSWLEGPTRVPKLMAELEVLIPRGREVRYVLDRIRGMDRGDPATLPDRIRTLVGEDIWKRLEDNWRNGGPFPEVAYVSGGPHQSAGPPTTPEGQRRLQRLLREAHGLSRADAAAAASERLGPAAAGVSEHQIKRYEAGQASRIRHLPAVLDLIYGGGGHTCFESVRVRRIAPGRVEVLFPNFWLGPVTIQAEPTIPYPSAGVIGFETEWWRNEQPLSVESCRFTYCRTVQDDPLCVSTPPGWTVRAAWMGHDSDAVDSSRGWIPSQRHEDELLDHYISGWMACIGKTRADFDRAFDRAPLAS